jgi:hypothetical protein
MEAVQHAGTCHDREGGTKLYGECLLHVSTLATTRVALPVFVQTGVLTATQTAGAEKLRSVCLVRYRTTSFAFFKAHQVQSEPSKRAGGNVCLGATAHWCDCHCGAVLNSLLRVRQKLSIEPG